MKIKYSRPRWFILYLVIGAFMVALYLATSDSLPNSTRIVVGGTLLVLMYVVIAKWLEVNEVAILMDDMRKEDPSIRNIATRTAPVWLAAVLSYLGDLFQR